MLKTQLITLFFENMQGKVEEVWSIWEIAIPFIKSYVVPAAKRFAAPEIGEVVSKRKKKLKTFA